MVQAAKEERLGTWQYFNFKVTKACVSQDDMGVAKTQYQ